MNYQLTLPGALPGLQNQTLSSCCIRYGDMIQGFWSFGKESFCSEDLQKIDMCAKPEPSRKVLGQFPQRNSAGFSAFPQNGLQYVAFFRNAKLEGFGKLNLLNFTILNSQSEPQLCPSLRASGHCSNLASVVGRNLQASSIFSGPHGTACLAYFQFV